MNNTEYQRLAKELTKLADLMEGEDIDSPYYKEYLAEYKRIQNILF